MLKVSWKDIFAGFRKKTVLYTTILMFSKARQVLRHLFSFNMEYSSVVLTKEMAQNDICGRGY